MMADFSTHALTGISLDKAAFSSNNLKDGGFVFVRVLGESKNGRLLVSFAGNVFEAGTKEEFGALKAGDSFKAQLKVVNGNVHLVPLLKEKAENIDEQGLLNKDEIYAQMFAKMGLLQDETSLKLLQFMRENGVYFSKQELVKLQKKAKSFGTKENKAAEIAAYLKSKGIEPSDDTIEEILSLLETELKPRKTNLLPEKKTDSFLDFIYSNAADALGAKQGLLTLSNHLGNSDSHWIVLPFEKQLKNQLWHGTIRILLDKTIHSVKKFYVNAKNEEKSLIFEFFPPKNMHKAFEIRYAIVPEASKNEVGHFTQILESIFAAEEGRSVKITYSQNLQNECFVDSELFIKGVDEEA